MEMNDRIKQVRVDAGLTQEKFADRLGLKRNSVANYEIGRNVPLDAILLSICREFNINENWLRTGGGDMHCFTGDDEMKQLAQQYALLNDSDRELVKKIIDSLAQKSN